MYNLRANDPAYNRLTFVLLGVAIPLNLMEDLSRTPFDIGTRIVLQEFSYAEVAPLRLALDEFCGEQGDAMMRHSFGTNFDRLVTLKRKYDPDNLFRLNQNVRP